MAVSETVEPGRAEVRYDSCQVRASSACTAAYVAAEVVRAGGFVIRAAGLLGEIAQCRRREVRPGDPDRVDRGARLVRGVDGIAERMQARDVLAVGHDDDRATGPLVVREPVGGDRDRVVERGSGLGVDGDAAELVAGGRRGRPRGRSG